MPDQASAAHTRLLEDEAATERLGGALARALGRIGGRDALLVTLAGDLGAGKTALARAALRALGVLGTIRSPTYTLAEPYDLADGARACHLDLYRLGGAEELEMLGFRDFLLDCRLILLEWPERVPEAGARADLEVALSYRGDGGRRARLSHRTEAGRRLLCAMLTEFDADPGGDGTGGRGGRAPPPQRESEM